MRKVLKSVLVLAAIAALAIGSSADAGGGGEVDCMPPAICYADASADADVSVGITMSHTGPDHSPKAGIDWVTIEVSVEGNSEAIATAVAYVKKGIVIAGGNAGTDLLANTAVTGPNGNVIASDFYYGASQDWDFDLDMGKNALAVAGAYSGPLGATFSFTFLPTEAGEYNAYVYGDSIAYANSYSVALGYWIKFCMDHDWDFAWDEAMLRFWAPEYDHLGRRVNFALGPNDGVIQPSPRPVWGSCGSECSNYDGHFPFATFIPGVDYALDYWYPGVAPYTAGVFRTLKKGANIPLTLWLRENPTDGKMYYCNVALEDGRDYVMSGGMDCE